MHVQCSWETSPVNYHWNITHTLIISTFAVTLHITLEWLSSITSPSSPPPPDSVGNFRSKLDNPNSMIYIGKKINSTGEILKNTVQVNKPKTTEATQILMPLCVNLHLRHGWTNGLSVRPCLRRSLKWTNGRTNMHSNNVHHDRRRHAVSTSLRLVDHDTNGRRNGRTDAGNQIWCISDIWWQ